MSFHLLQNSTTADASDVMDNYYWIGQGSRMPMGGNSLAYTTGVYDIGSSTYRWKDLYCTNLNVSGTITCSNIWSLLSTVDISTTSSRIQFTGLNGDSDNEYRIIIKLVSVVTAATCIVDLTINGDSAANYGYLGMVNGSGIENISASSFQYFVRADSATSGLTDSIIYAKTGLVRTGIYTSFQNVMQNNTCTILYIGAFWDNTSNTITTIELNQELGTTNIGAGSHIELYRRG